MTSDNLSLSTELEGRLSRLGLEFLADFLQTARRHRPDNAEALAELGHVYTRLGRYSEGLAVDRELVQREPQNPTVHYNLACSLALLGEVQPALDALEQAIELGYDDGTFLEQDADLAALRAEARFQTLVTRLRKTAS